MTTRTTTTTPTPNRTRIVYSVCNKIDVNKILKLRELGLKRYVGYDDHIASKLYSNLDQFQLNDSNTSPGDSCGGVFNLEFSQDGRLLVAACEKNCVLMYDTSTQKKFYTLERAHDNCVNCVRFLNNKQFATCSDDNTIKLWDIRNLKRHLKTLYGHSNWVKNIEYSHKDNIMVTSAFDGSIYAWDLTRNSIIEEYNNNNSMLYDKVFLMNGLMRTKLSPDGTKMIISTTGGYMIIIHDLNLATLSTDFKSFRPILYRLMQLSGQSFPAGTIFNYLFLPTRRRNRVEFIDDFTIDAEVISSLQVHPYSWNVVSRCLSSNEEHEVTSVHDIQKREIFEYEYDINVDDDDDDGDDNDDHGNGGELDDFQQDNDENNHQIPSDLWMGFISNYQYNDGQARPNLFEGFHFPAMGIINSGLINQHNNRRYNEYFQQYPDERNKVITNLPRLTHFVNEKNVGSGFIKELCYSNDGRLICSPFGKGIRLLGFNENYQELMYCVPNEPPKQLTTLLEFNDYHPDIVVSCKFSPTDLLLVSGCLRGQIVWYKPIL